MGAALVVAFGAAGCGTGGDTSAAKGGGGGSAATSDSSTAGVTDSKITLGVIADATGPTAATQTPGKNGFEAYIKMANAAGGVNGRTIDVKTCDEKYTAEAGLQCLKQFTTQDPVFALGTSLNSGTFQVAAEPVVARAKIPVIGPQSSQKEVQAAGNRYIFELQCSYADMADVAIPYTKELTGVAKPRVSTVVLPVPGGIDWSTLLEERVKKAGGTYIGTHKLDPAATQADVIAQQIAKEKPDWVGMHGGVANLVVLQKSLAKFDVDVPVIGIGQNGVSEAWTSVPESTGKNFTALGCFTSGDIESEGAAEMLKGAQAAGHAKEASAVTFVQGWVSGMVTVAALKEAGKDLTRGTFIKALEGMTDFSTGGLSGNVQFGPQRRAGITVVRPYTFDYATGKITTDSEYADWERYITNVDLPKTLAGQ